jgi:hypothetical protein
MKLCIYILLFVLLIIYINKHSKCLENFDNDDFVKHHYDAPNPYDILKTEKITPIQIDSNSNNIPGFNYNNFNIYSDKEWIVKKIGFSDIYNYEDSGGTIKYNFINNTDNQTDKQTDKQTDNQTDNQTDKQTDNQTDKQTDNQTIITMIDYQGNKYTLLGTATNIYYNQYFYIFENLVNQKLTEPLLKEQLKYMKNNRIFQYILVKIHNGNPKIIHWVGPRNKIDLGNIVYLSLANFQLGPLQIDKIN